MNALQPALPLPLGPGERVFVRDLCRLGTIAGQSDHAMYGPVYCVDLAGGGQLYALPSALVHAPAINGRPACSLVPYPGRA